MSEGLTGEALDGLVDLAREAEGLKKDAAAGTRDIHGETYVATEWKKVEKPEPMPGVLELNTLQSLVDYIRDQPDVASHSGRKAFVLIQGPKAVSYGFGAGGPYNRRAWVAQAKAITPELNFGREMGVEEFLVTLRTHFTLTDGVKTLVEHFSHIDAQNSVRLTDDGLSQAITVNQGVRGKAEVRIPNPCPLQPLRTFSEVTQPETPFLIRLSGGGMGTLPTVKLIEADLGQWRLAAIRNVKTFLADALPGVAVYG